MTALQAHDERVFVIVHSVRSRLVDRVLPALGQPIIGDARPIEDLTAAEVMAARQDLIGCCALLMDALDAIGGGR